jgi:hypothetical protein
MRHLTLSLAVFAVAFLPVSAPANALEILCLSTSLRP